MFLTGGELHDARPRPFQPGNNARPKRCADFLCPSWDKCKRPRLDGRNGNFHWNRGGGKFCASLMSTEE